MAATQDHRLLAIFTPLGKDHLLLDKISGSEAISKLFSFEVDLLHEEDEAGNEPTIIQAATLLGKGVTVVISQPDGTEREISGIVNRFSQGYRNTRFTYYRATIVPHVWILTQRIQSRIFQNKSVPDILSEVFAGFHVRHEIQGSSNRRNYCVQYRETDLDFASRLMEEEGIYYFFEHANGNHTMVLADTPQSHRDCPSKHQIPFITDVAGQDNEFISKIRSWRSDHQLQTGKVTLWDYNFQLPTRKLDTTQESRFTIGDNKKLEHYDHPGGFGRKYDGIDLSGGEQASELGHVDSDSTQTVQRRLDSLDANYRVMTGSADCCSMTPGYRFELFNHPTQAENAKYVVTGVKLESDQSPSYVSDEPGVVTYTNTFTCIAYGAGAPPFRPPLETQKPIVHGSQTAFVVGPSGEEIFTDKYGRVKVQFHWDREGQADAGSSCWIRVAQTWAGNKWGGMFIPRIGMEVIVDFLEGDPDRPIISGCVYNPQTMPPYTLPDEKTKSTMKSNSSKGGGGFNEIRFEDKKGSEQVFIHAERNKDLRVKNDSLEYVGNDRHLIVKNDKLEKVSGNKHMHIVGDQKEKVDGSISIKSAVDIDEKAGTKFAVEAGSEIHLKAGASLTLEAGTTLTLKVGGNFINLNSGGVFISGSMVMINSGGAAGSGTGSNPDPPTDAKEADKAEPGSRSEVPPSNQPPARSVFTSPAALALSNAAISGAPFCEICSRV